MIAADPIAAEVVVTGGELRPRTAIEVGADGRIRTLVPLPDDVVAPPRLVGPGFVDLQVNGIDDIDVASARQPADWRGLDQRLLAAGVTAWCPTLVTAPLDAYRARLDAIAAAMSRPAAGRPAILGAHLEGPFLTVAGAHPPDHLRPAVDLDWLDQLPLGDVVRLVTLAPELPGSLDAIRLLAGRGVTVALGHTRATPDQVAAGVEAGARLVTHLFNAMPPLHHRSPGPVGAALADDRLTVSMIADGVHLHDSLLAMVARVKPPGRWMLVTDSSAWRASRQLGRDIRLVDGAPRLPDGTLAGSALTMPDAVRRTVEAGVEVPVAVAAASSTPAAVLDPGTGRGAIEVGAPADLVALSWPGMVVQKVWIAGEEITLTDHPA